MAASTPTFIHPINMFMGIRQQNCTFCLDLSGSMYNTLNVVKEHLIQYLLEQSVMADFNVTRLFNLIGFSTEVYPWATNMVLWNKATVNSCLDWIKDLETKTGTNTLDALLTAFADSNCHAISLVTDDISDQEPYTVLNQISLASRGRPIHIIYILNGRDEDRSTTEFLQNIATITKGSLKIVACDRNGVNKITPVSSLDTPTAIQLTNLAINANNYKVLNSVMVPAGPILHPCHHHHSQAQVAPPIPPCPANPIIQTSAVVPHHHHLHLHEEAVPYELAVQQKLKETQALFTNTAIVTTSPAHGLNQLLNFTYNYPRWVLEPSIYKYPSFLPRVHITTEGKIPSKAIAWSRYRPVKVLQDGQVVGLTMQDANLPIPNDIAYAPDAGSLLLNKTVLARSALDGYYYKGKVMSQVLAHRFIIQFGPNNHGKYKDCYYQNTAIYDIIHFEDTYKHPLKINDKCLALIDDSEKYAPAEVLEGFEKRGSSIHQDQITANHPITVRFANGRTRSCPFNEALWVPDAMHDRIKFELQLPGAARKYLEDYNDDYPNNSLPGYPTNEGCIPACESVVMPRMVYDIWPYFVPFYPLYSNILYPTLDSTASGQMNSLTEVMNAMPSTAPMTPNYYRQIRSNPAAVNADCLNRSVVGTTLTPCELDKKIQAQIFKNQHLIASHPPPAPHQHHHHNHNHPPPHSPTPPPAHHHHTRSHSPHHSPHHSPQHGDGHDCPSQHQPRSHSPCSSESPHIKQYQDMVRHLYHDCKKLKPCCATPHAAADKHDMKRAKSVTFCHDSERAGLENEPESEKCYNKSLPYKFCAVDQPPKLLKRKEQSSENRWGNPKVSVGLPEKSFYRPRSALGLANRTLAPTPEGFSAKEKAQKAAYERRERGTIERLLNEQKKQEKRDRYRQELSRKITDFETKRTETNVQKSLATLKSKQDQNSLNMSRMESIKVDMEGKEQQRIQHLRNESEKRDATRLNRLEGDLKKEQDKMAFKSSEQNQRNQLYHNRMVVEEQMRLNQQAQLTAFHNRQQRKEQVREQKGQRVAELQGMIDSNNKEAFNQRVIKQ